MSYLINENGCVYAETAEELKSGATVRAGFIVTDDTMNADREFNLVNAFTLKVSNAKKHDSYAYSTTIYATAINGRNDEFRLESCETGEMI